MRLKLKLALLALSTGTIALGTGACLSRWAGDYVGDLIVSYAIDVVAQG